MPQSRTDVDLSMSRTFILQDGEALPAAPVEDAQTLATGIVIDSKYKIISLLGEGGMGSVYLAHHLLLDKDMALKTFRSRHIDQDAARRFELEARAIAKLSHKNIVQVFDFGINDGRPFYTMELLGGDSLVKYINDGSLSLRETLEVFVEVADGLSHAHKAGIIHRDIKPDNIYLGAPKGKAGKISSVKIVDFGIAKLAMEGTIDSSSASDQNLTKVGRIFGSPLYMSPEQSTGLPTDHRSDIYSFGCTLFEAVTGRPPFIGKTSSATLSLHRFDPPPTLAAVAPDRVFPQRLEGLMARLLKKEQAEREQSCVEIRHELARILALLKDRTGATTISPQLPLTSRIELVRQAKTDPILAADRAISKAIKEIPKKAVISTVVAAVVALASLGGLAFWLKDKIFPQPNATTNAKLPVAPSHGFLDIKQSEALQPRGPAAQAARSRPPAKFLVERTDSTRTFKFPSGDNIGILEFDDQKRCRPPMK